MTLIERLEALRGPDREVDGLIMQHINPEREFHQFEDALGMRCLYDSAAWEMPKKYTASIDAAMTLVPEGFYPLIAKQSADRGQANMGQANNGLGFNGYAATPAIALCIASLRARSADNG